ENIKYAAKHGIDICTAIDINDFKWKEKITIPVAIHLKEYKIEVNYMIIQAGPAHFELPNKWLISTDNGNSSELIGKFALDVISKFNLQTGNNVINAPDNSLTISVANTESVRVWHPLKDFSISVNSNIRNVFRYCSPNEYQAL